MLPVLILLHGSRKSIVKLPESVTIKLGQNSELYKLN